MCTKLDREELLNDVLERNALLSDAYQLQVWMYENAYVDDTRCGPDEWDHVSARWHELDKQLRGPHV